MDGIERAAQVAKEHGTKVILNPAPARELPESLLACVDIITPNETEAEVLTGIKVDDEVTAKAAAAKLHEKALKP